MRSVGCWETSAIMLWNGPFRCVLKQVSLDTLRSIRTRDWRTVRVASHPTLPQTGWARFAGVGQSRLVRYHGKQTPFPSPLFLLTLQTPSQFVTPLDPPQELAITYLYVHEIIDYFFCAFSPNRTITPRHHIYQVLPPEPPTTRTSVHHSRHDREVQTNETVD